MAKTKTAKVKDLRPDKITDKQLEKIQGIINNLNKIQLDIGMLETRKHGMLHGIAGMQDQLTLIQQELEKDYGTTDIDITNGTINYPENGQADKKD